MSAAELLRRFVAAGRPERYADLRAVPVDADLAARNAARIAECRERLGSHWICALPVPRREPGARP